MRVYKQTVILLVILLALFSSNILASFNTVEQFNSEIRSINMNKSIIYFVKTDGGITVLKNGLINEVKNLVGHKLKITALKHNKYLEIVNYKLSDSEENLIIGEAYYNESDYYFVSRENKLYYIESGLTEKQLNKDLLIRYKKGNKGNDKNIAVLDFIVIK